jgi:hypothetical protein
MTELYHMSGRIFVTYIYDTSSVQSILVYLRLLPAILIDIKWSAGMERLSMRREKPISVFIRAFRHCSRKHPHFFCSGEI